MTYIADKIKQAIVTSQNITTGTTPVVYFGCYETATSCTIGINPSDREFYNKNGELLTKPEQVRLCSRAQLNKKDEDVLTDADVAVVKQYCDEYFSRNPYKSWFDRYERFLNAFDCSYYQGNTVHLDLVQWATTPFWSKLTPEVKQQLLDSDVPFLKKLLEDKSFDYIFLNGATVVKEVQKSLDLQLQTHEIRVDGIKNKVVVYTGDYQKSKVIGWSAYLQSMSVNSYDNIERLSKEIYAISTK